MRNDIIEQLKACEFRALCDKYFGNDFLWTIRGSSELSGTYTDIDDFFDNIIARLNALLLPGWKMHILDTFVDGDTMIVEMKGEVTAKSGNDYNNEYCWIFKFGDGVLKSITAYYDSLLVNKTLAENE
tara:strand:- start:60816 stop:61199 length:384 start_codon:yes stop_codon:yes gene_type:complete